MPQGNVIGNQASLDASPEAYGKYLQIRFRLILLLI